MDVGQAAPAPGQAMDFSFLNLPAAPAPAPAPAAPMIVRIKRPPPRKPAAKPTAATATRKPAKPAAAPATQKKRKGRAASPANGTPAAPPAKRAHVAASTEEKAAFGALVGRAVNKKFPGSGYYDGVVDSIDASKPATYVIVWEDGMTTKMKDTAVQKILK